MPFLRVALLLCAAATASIGAAPAPDESAEPEAAPPSSESVEAGDSDERPSRARVPAEHVTGVRRTYLDELAEDQTLTRHWFGHGAALEEAGVQLTLNLWVAVQGNVLNGPPRTAGTTGQYELGGHFDLERLAGIDGAGVYLEVDGGWDYTTGLLGELSGINGEFIYSNGVVVSHLWYQQSFLDDRLRFRIGKLNITDGMNFHGQTVAFDGNLYANFGGTQFLNTALINNPSIAIPQDGLGAVLLVEPVDRLYVAVSGSNASADGLSAGFSSAFGTDAKWLGIVETGMAIELDSPHGPLPGQFNVGYWYSGLRGLPNGWGVYLGMNQLLYREGPDDEQGLGIFARYGYSNGAPNGIEHFWSLGGQYRGPIPGRDDDIVGLGWAQAFTNGSAGFTAPYEGVLETYYRAEITPWLYVSPMLQLIVNPGSTSSPTGLVLGLRGQIVF